jgi:hypothetical protein
MPFTFLADKWNLQTLCFTSIDFTPYQFVVAIIDSL